MKRDRKKLFRNLFVFVCIILVTFYIIFKDQDISQFRDILLNIDLKFIFISVICMMLYFVCDAINIKRMLKRLGEKCNLYNGIRYSLIGFFFSSVTPAASGGQPMQIYYMKKNKISVANSTLTLLINLSCMQVVTISLALVSLLFNFDNMNGVLSSCFILGIALNLTALVLLIVSIFSKRVSNALVRFSIKIFKFFRVKNIEEKKERIEKELQKYHESATKIKDCKGAIAKNLLTTYLQFILYYSITYWVYCGFGLSQYNILQIISLQAILFATVSGIPSPGAVGVSEGGFLELFKNVYSKETISSAMLLNRGVNFYLFVILSSIVVLVYGIKDDIDIKNGNINQIEDTEDLINENEEIINSDNSDNNSNGGIE